MPWKPLPAQIGGHRDTDSVATLTICFGIWLDRLHGAAKRSRLPLLMDVSWTICGIARHCGSYRR